MMKQHEDDHETKSEQVTHRRSGACRCHGPHADHSCGTGRYQLCGEREVSAVGRQG